MAKRTFPIDYTSRDFDSIRDDLINYTKRYYPDTFKDFSEASFGSLMLDTVAYTGDIMSFYLDYQVNEGFLDTASEYSNVLRLAKQMGYKFTGAQSTTGMVSVYAIIPASPTGLGPDNSYLPILKRNSTLTSKNGGSYILVEDMRFDDPANDIVVANVNTTTGTPTSYAIKAQGQVISGKLETVEIPIGEFQRFRTVEIPDSNAVEIISVFDSEGNEYFEVEYLTQDMIYKSVPNNDVNTKANAPSLIRPFTANRRFIVNKDRDGMTIQFGSGTTQDISTSGLSDPANVVLRRFAKDYITDTTFDPTDLVGSDKMGIAPANTTLIVNYRSNTINDASAAVGAITKVASPVFEFVNPIVANTTAASNVITSLEAFNEEPILGSVTNPSVEEIRMQALNIFPSQNRAVTGPDYEAIIYAMPGHLGAIKRCRVIRDQDSIKRNLNVFVVSEDSFGKLTVANSAIKENIKIHLNRYRMINDTVDILDAKIVNIGIDFEVIAADEIDRFEVLDNATTAVVNQFGGKTMFIGERFYITDVMSALNKVRGVADTVKVKLVSKRGSSYSSSTLNIDQFMSPDGRYLSVPDNVILEIKFPKIDIKGTVR